MTMEKVGDDWLVDDMDTDQLAGPSCIDARARYVAGARSRQAESRSSRRSA